MIDDAFIVAEQIVPKADPMLGVEMASTGEVACLGDNFEEAFLKALGTAASRLRSRLGESLSSVQALDTPIDRATTPSLDALKAYTMGVQSQGLQARSVTIAHFKRVRTPTLVIHSEGDLRCNVEQAEQVLAWLERAERQQVGRLAEAVPGALHLGASWRHRGDDRRRLLALDRLSSESGVPLLALGDVLMHHPGRKALADVLLCIREGCTIDEAGWRLETNAERHLKPPAEMARLFRERPEAVARTLDLVERCRFSLDELRYEYPREVAEGEDPQARLERLARAGAQERYPRGVPEKVAKALEHELWLIGTLRYAPYFLTVYDVVRFARARLGRRAQGGAFRLDDAAALNLTQH